MFCKTGTDPMTGKDKPGKMIVVSAPSGAGKTTIVRHLLQNIPSMEFSVSGTSRPQRPGEVNGRDYWFLSAEEFKEKIRKEEFVEWEEVYPDLFYGTLKSEIERIWKAGRHVVFDVDVKGGLNLKGQFADRALSVFISPPSLEVLESRLRKRSTETDEKIRERIGKAAMEMEYASRFDRILVNDRLEKALQEAEHLVRKFIGEEK